MKIVRFSKYFQRVVGIFVLLGGILSLNGASALEIPSTPEYYVNDYAHLLNPSVRQSLEAQLEDFEKKTSNQLLVVTVPGLQDDTIEEFGIRLAEKWKPGQKDRNNGAILLVAPKERKVRIEVGYGLEGVLTDALTQSIIQNEILPSFKNRDFNQGVTRGAVALMQASAGEYQGKPSSSKGRVIFNALIIILFLFFWLLSMIFKGSRTLGGRKSHTYWGSFGGGGWGGGSSSGGGFSSGGGSFGGGGSSGSW